MDEEQHQQIKEILHVEEKAPKRVKKLTEQQGIYMKALYDKHGDDYKAMARDIKLNYLQFTAAQCRKKLTTHLNPSQNLKYEVNEL